MSPSKHNTSIPSHRATANSDASLHDTTIADSGKSKSGKKARRGHDRDSNEINKSSPSSKKSSKNKPKVLQTPHALPLEDIPHAFSGMGGGFALDQTPRHGYADSETIIYGSSYPRFDALRQAGDDPAAADGYSPMARWLSESRKDEPFHAFPALDSGSYGGTMGEGDFGPCVVPKS